jgi:ATP-dependent protease ClpP protease subunit
MSDEEDCECFVELRHVNHIIFFSDVNDEAFRRIRTIILKLETKTKPPNEVFLHINSAGGDPYYGLAIYDLLCNLARIVKLTVIIEGQGASAASVFGLAAEIENRYMLANSIILIHQPSVMNSGGTLAEQKVEVETMVAILNRYATIYQKKTQLTLAQSNRHMRDDHEFGIKEAIKYGFVNAPWLG